MILFLIIYFMQRTIRRQSEVFNCYYTGEFNTYLNSVNFEAVYARVSAISGYLGLAVLIAYPTYFFVYLPSKYIAILNGTGIIFAESPFFPDIATIVFSSIAVIMGIVLKIPQVKAFMKNIYLCKFKSDYSTDKSPYRSFIS
ncbi:hypothetical protein SDC9_148266 [bioreactor metagenome]|uniref:Uncharacterized protein n=1 Tax=bioreactor metagenome TaxID=1076179 RepID=A0A645EHZ1_9ZZZZ